MSERRYDIDWIRVIAIGLLIIYHTAIVFQPWGLMIGFMTNEEKWEKLWLPMTMLNVWRIPILFFIAGIGVYFSFLNRDWKALVKERLKRIGIPLLFGSTVIVPSYMFLLQHYYGWKLEYLPSMGHLWFLGNILIYVGLTLPLFHSLKMKGDDKIAKILRRFLGTPYFLLTIILCCVTETYILKPPIYEKYAMTLHGFILGWLAFIFGYLFGYAGKDFWVMLVRYKWLFLFCAILLFTVRTAHIMLFPSQVNLAIESCLWIFAIFAFANQYLSKPHNLLQRLSKAAYPIYIMHMVALGLGAYLILPLSIVVELKFILLLVIAFALSIIFYLAVKRHQLTKILFGL